MSVYVESCKKVYLGNGLTREWSYDFPLPDVSYMEVYVKAPGGTPELLTSGYLVDMVGKKVTYPASAASPALAEGWMLVLRREVPATQPMELPNQQGRFLAKNTEAALDRATMQIQQLREILSRAVVGPVDQTDSGVAYQTLLEAVEEARRIRDETAALVEGISQDYADALAAALARLDTELAAALIELKAKTDADVAAARSAAEAALREADRAFAQAGAAEDWADASCTCAKTAGELGREFVAVMQSYKGLYTEISVVDGGDAMTFAGILLINDGSDTAGWGSVSEIRDGQTSHAGSWYVIDPLVLQALNPKGIKDVSEINENGEITITIDNTM